MSQQNLVYLKELWVNWRSSRVLILFIVVVAIFLDNVLLTVVVPIIPDYLYHLENPTKPDDTYNFLAKNCSHNELIQRRHYFVGNPIEFRRIVGTHCNWAMNRSEIENKQKAISLKNENRKIGIMFASKPIVQLIVTPFIGLLTNRIGYSIPMFAGFVILFLSTITFAFSTSFAVLFLARAIQGAGSSCTSVAGFGMLADRYPDDDERGKAMGIALGGLGLGVLVGPPFGGLMYHYVGKASSFLVLAGLALFDGLLQLSVLQPGVSGKSVEGASLKALITDPYILIAIGTITLGNIGAGVLETSLPIWMMTTMQSSEVQLGLVLLPTTIMYLITTNLFGLIANKIGRWLCCIIGIVLISCALITIPMATSIYSLIIPIGIFGFGIGMVDSSVMPTLAYLVDIRHTSVYGTVYAIADAAYCLSFAIGPVMSAFIIQAFSFRAMLYIVAFICLCYAPLIFFLRNPPAKNEKMPIISNENHSSVSYTHSKSLDNENDR